MKLRNLLAYGLPALGLLVVGYYVAQVGPGRLVDAASTMGWWLAALLLAPLFQFVVHAIGWGLTLSRENLRKLGWLRLSVLQTFAFGLSGIVPMYVMVSEPMKLAFLRGTDVDKEDGQTVAGTLRWAGGAAGTGQLLLRAAPRAKP